jgi:Asp-tRNA(Asn)/Glu-tRNA(Gln) amidotransferase A subunit family amidase
VTRSVRDAAAALDATAGAEIGRSSALPLRQSGSPGRHLIQNANQRRKPRRNSARIWASRRGGYATNAGWRDQRKLPADLGLGPRHCSRFCRESSGQNTCTRGIRGVDLEPLSIGKNVTGAQYQGCWKSLQGVSRQVAAWQQTYEAWITPVLATPPMKIGSINLEETDLMKGWAPIAAYVPFTALQNITGQPAISLPLAWSKSGLPIGAQFVGRFGEEHLLLQLAAQIEKAEPWSNKRPPVYG